MNHRNAVAAVLAIGGLAAGAGLMAAGAGRTTTQDVSIQSIRGIEGIDTVVLQNLEAVLRMQTPVNTANARTAAALVNMEPTLSDNTGDGDARQELVVEMEGS